MGRVVGDGGCFHQVVDIAVLPRHQGKEVGKRIMVETWSSSKREFLRAHTSLSSLMGKLKASTSSSAFRRRHRVRSGAHRGRRSCRRPRLLRRHRLGWDVPCVRCGIGLVDVAGAIGNRLLVSGVTLVGLGLYVAAARRRRLTPQWSGPRLASLQPRTGNVCRPTPSQPPASISPARATLSARRRQDTKIKVGRSGLDNFVNGAPQGWSPIDPVRLENHRLNGCRQ